MKDRSACALLVRGLVLGLLLTTLAPSLAPGATIIFQPPRHLGKDAFVSSVFHHNGDDGQELLIGGWGDQYWSFLRFDLRGLPKQADLVYLDLAPKPPGGTATPLPMDVWQLSTPWAEPPSWDGDYAGVYRGRIGAPTPGQTYRIDITSVYDRWQSGARNEGLAFLPTANDNRFNRFYSSDAPTALRTSRPRLIVQFTPSVTLPALKSPMPGGQSWLLTTEIGGGDCATSKACSSNSQCGSGFTCDRGLGSCVLSTHTDSAGTAGNFFALDFAPYSTSGYDSTVPVFAAGSGRVYFAGWNSSAPGNGYHVIIDHDGDGKLTTGFQTLYLHLRSSPVVTAGASVAQGQRLGYLGNSGGAWGEHLHFQVWFQGRGTSTVDTLSMVRVEGAELREYLTECSASGTRTRYFPSSNTSQ